jgi:CBS domain-containing protein
MLTKEIMTSPVVTVSPDDHLKDVAATLVRHGINAAPVVDAGGRLLGIVSEADVLPLEAAADRRARQGPAAGAARRLPRRVREVMTRSVYTIADDADAAVAARLLLRHGRKSVPVVAGGRVVGVVSRRDLLAVLARADRDIRDELERGLLEAATALRRLGVDVSDGTVRFTGDCGERARDFLEGLARAVPGVVEVAWARGGDG